VIDRPEPAAVHVAEHDASDLLCVLRGQHHRRLAGQPAAEEAGARPSGRQGREDPPEELAGKVQLLRRPDRPDRELAHDHHYEHRNRRGANGNQQARRSVTSSPGQPGRYPPVNPADSTGLNPRHTTSRR